MHTRKYNKIYITKYMFRQRSAILREYTKKKEQRSNKLIHVLIDLIIFIRTFKYWILEYKSVDNYKSTVL